MWLRNWTRDYRGQHQPVVGTGLEPATSGFPNDSATLPSRYCHRLPVLSCIVGKRSVHPIFSFRLRQQFGFLPLQRAGVSGMTNDKVNRNVCFSCVRISWTVAILSFSETTIFLLTRVIFCSCRWASKTKRIWSSHVYVSHRGATERLQRHEFDKNTWLVGWC